jgi:predicted dehydrogenase
MALEQQIQNDIAVAMKARDQVRLDALRAVKSAIMIAKTAGGAVGTIEVSKLTIGANDELNFAIYGEKGALKFNMMDLNWLYFYDGTAPAGSLGGERGFTRIECVGRYDAPGGIFPSFKAPIGWLRGHLHSMYEFLSAVHSGTPACPSFDDAAAVQRVLAMALEDDKN